MANENKSPGKTGYKCLSSVTLGTVVDGKLSAKRYEPGDTIELAKEDASSLLAVGAVEMLLQHNRRVTCGRSMVGYGR